MNTKHLWLKRMALGGIIAVGAVLLVILLINLLLNGIVWGERVDYYNFQFTTDRCAYVQFGSAALAVLVEMACVFALGAAIGLATLPFAESWTALLRLSVLHFVITGGLALLVGWSYGWFGLGPEGPWIVLAVYQAVYLLIWFIRWCVWYRELRNMRRALGLERRHEKL